ncbi:MAG: DNA polymerase III subunit gamma/tau [Clostridia bacterium]|nr:DNA polymerase III subunit gamma/tau [Clostridia bacterium]
MDHKALYRKFRPKVFEEVVGQEHLTNTLRNQMLTDNVAHAYLFSGIRGTGKTSTAKIFARALNCMEPVEGNPCNVCENCKQALSDNAIDIIEIDAASNNGVDDIRDLREKVKYPPSRMKYKIYIIDEVHMLSIGAFNALLKTLEEPPSYVIFIFATTELHKIPATIISRCQKFELKRIQHKDIENLMSRICDASGFTYDDVVLEQIARLADGAARDSLSILDQCFAANEDKHISLEILNNVLGLVTESVIFDLVEGLYESNGKKVLSLLNDVISSGKDIKRFTNQLIEFLRYLMLVKISKDLSALVNVSEETLDLIRQHGEKMSLNLLIRSINILTQVEVDSKWSSNSRVILEIGLIKILQPDLETSVESIMERLEKLEKRPVAVPQLSQQISKEVNVEKSIIEHSMSSVSQEEIIEEIVEEPIQYASSEELNLDEESLEDLWEEVLDLVKQTKISTHALLVDGHFEGIKEHHLCVSYKEGYGFHMIAIEKPENRVIVEQAIQQVYGKALRVQYITKNSDEDENEYSKPEDKLYDFLGSHKNKLEIEDK